MIPDMQCTLAPDSILGYSIKACCIAHDLGGSDEALRRCIEHAVPIMGGIVGVIAGFVYYVGVKTGRPILTKWRNRNDC